jgi:MoaA/NifB/PqqE/SkfB family radical SAM enzyme
MTEKELEQEKRQKLKREKPLVFEKILKIGERHKNGIATPIIDIAYDYVCNLRCQHCSAARFEKKARKITPVDLKKLSDEAHAIGLCQYNISGGEPLIFKDLDEVIASLQPDRFHLSMSTNGHFLTLEKAKHLKSIGLDKVKISLDDFDEKLHDENRRNQGAYAKAISSMFNAYEAGLNVTIATVATHQNCKTERIVKMAEFAQKNGFALDIHVARAIGAWEGRHEVLIDEEDDEFLRKIHEQYPVLHRDTFPSYGMDKGCGCVKSSLHLTQYGDILPCVFIHIAIGSVFDESLADIIKRGQSIKHFNKYSRLCLSGEDRGFIEKYMTKFYGKPLPIHWSEAFGEEDFIK